MAALKLARDLGARSLTVRTDSRVLLEQLGPPMAKPARPIARLSQLFEAARAQMQGFDELVLQWVPRHRNTEADALARMAHSAAASVLKPVQLPATGFMWSNRDSLITGRRHVDVPQQPCL
jgi:ribonuclease HI